MGQVVVPVVTMNLLFPLQAAQKSPAVTLSLLGTEMTPQVRKPRRLFSERTGWKHLTEAEGSN